ncbi:hypothetical protein ONS96_012250 [Cadophora gregata f. sp. sojae]|nr:hypothetical protein ONS96_012250 [Cadophora gregata f. sp. sojae]
MASECPIGIAVGHGVYQLKDDLWKEIKDTYPFDDNQDLGRLWAEIQRRTTRATTDPVPTVQAGQLQAPPNLASNPQSKQSQLAPIHATPQPKQSDITRNPTLLSQPAQLAVESPSKHPLKPRENGDSVKRRKLVGQDTKGGELFFHTEESCAALRTNSQNMEKLLEENTQEIQGLNEMFNIQEESIQMKDNSIRDLQKLLENEKKLREAVEERASEAAKEKLQVTAERDKLRIVLAGIQTLLSKLGPVAQLNVEPLDGGF